jgi:hypothetical protein
MYGEALGTKTFKAELQIADKIGRHMKFYLFDLDFDIVY